MRHVAALLLLVTMLWLAICAAMALGAWIYEGS